MKLAVLIPCYHVERFVTDCLDSVLAAATPELEVFCCDDGSQDGTLAKLEAYAAKHPEVHVLTQPHAGVSTARNRLLDALPSAFDAFAFVDADDTVHQDYFTHLAEAMGRTAADVAEYAADRVRTETLVEDPSRLWLKRTNPGIRSAIVGKLISRRAAGSVRLRPELRYEEDLMYSYEVNAVIRRKVILPGFPYDYRYNPHSATQNLDWRAYVESACRRVELFESEFLTKGLVPAPLVKAFRRELGSDAFRMCLRKNLKKNPDPALRRELHAYAVHRLDSSVPFLFRPYRLARFFVFFT